KDYDYTIEYHPGKANVVADALRRKEIGDDNSVTYRAESLFSLRELRVQLDLIDDQMLGNISVRPQMRDVIAGR
ncbi:hypothetical protein, partial [Vibrio vulnificus]|uniref:hypothetical protein n=1 Tax=Vibrio vulnificus TaxID=672 RepID=UPI0019D47B09